MKTDGSRLSQFAVTLMYAQNHQDLREDWFFTSCVPASVWSPAERAASTSRETTWGLPQFRLCLKCTLTEVIGQQCRVAKAATWQLRTCPKLLYFNQVQCKICQVTDFLVGELVQFFVVAWGDMSLFTSLSSLIQSILLGKYVAGWGKLTFTL